MSATPISLLKLSKLSAIQPIVDPLSGLPAPSFVRLENDRAQNETTIVNALVEAVNEITAASDAASAAQSSAEAATTAVDAASASVNSLVSEMNLVNSFPQPMVIPGSIMTAAISSDPTKAQITITAHKRFYGDGSFVTMSGGSITGLALSTVYYVSYLNPARAGGPVSYTASTNPYVSYQGHDRHTVGMIVTPASGGSPIVGQPLMPPGIQAP